MANLFTAYARAKYANADLGGFSPLQFSPSPGKLVPLLPHQSPSQMLPPASVEGHQPVQEIVRSPSAASYSSTISIPRSDITRNRVVARVISRHYNPSQLGENAHHSTFYPIFVVKKLLLSTGKDAMTKSPSLIIFLSCSKSSGAYSYSSDLFAFSQFHLPRLLSFCLVFIIYPLVFSLLLVLHFPQLAPSFLIFVLYLLVLSFSWNCNFHIRAVLLFILYPSDLSFFQYYKFPRSHFPPIFMPHPSGLLLHTSDLLYSLNISSPFGSLPSASRRIFISRRRIPHYISSPFGASSLSAGFSYISSSFGASLYPSGSPTYLLSTRPILLNIFTFRRFFHCNNGFSVEFGRIP
jgi:hypothetical protein